MKKRMTAAVLTAMMLAVPAAASASEEFTGSFIWGDPLSEDQWEQTAVVFDDPRLMGSVVMTANPEQIEDDGVYRYSFHIENDAGAWQGDVVPGVQFDSTEYGTAVHVLTGEGAYEGLSAVAEVGLHGNTFRLRGLIVDAPMPEL
jgi:uncharacterized cupredoxin-like copper-binding protein